MQPGVERESPTEAAARSARQWGDRSGDNSWQPGQFNYFEKGFKVLTCAAFSCSFRDEISLSWNLHTFRIRSQAFLPLEWIRKVWRQSMWMLAPQQGPKMKPLGPLRCAGREAAASQPATSEASRSNQPAWCSGARGFLLCGVSGF